MSAKASSTMPISSDRDAQAVSSDGLLLHASDLKKSFGGVHALIDGRISLAAGSVHALCGGNGAGKSTFLNILMGIHPADSGTIICKGRPVRYATPAEALADGVAIITQELSPLLDLTVAENVFAGREPRYAGWFVDYRRMHEMTAELMARLHFDIDPRARLRTLSLAKIQLVEIAKAISRQGDILIMDEPTSAIGEKESEILFEAIRGLQAQGIGIIYVSHRLTDIFSIADQYTVFRDGRFVEAGAISGIDRQRLIGLIVGRDLGEHKRAIRPRGDDLLLEARGFTRAGHFEDIDLEISRGEIVGIYGLMGAGRSEFANAVYGNDPKDAGELRLDGQEAKITSPMDALEKGIALITEDRAQTGLVLTSSVAENISLSSLKQFSAAGFIRQSLETPAVDRMIQRLRVKTASRVVAVRKLSGGNQQKVVFARCLQTHPRLLLCDEPTRGVDEGAKREIYALLAAFVEAGNGVLLISSEIPEILANADRIVVFRRGRIAGEVAVQDATQEMLVHLAS